MVSIGRLAWAGSFSLAAASCSRNLFRYCRKFRKPRCWLIRRRLTLREILEKIFGLIPRFKSKDELLEEEFAKFIADIKPEEATAVPAIRQYFKAYVSSGQIRDIIDRKDFTVLATHPMFCTRDFKAVPAKYRVLIPDYVKDYVSLNQFAP